MDDFLLDNADLQSSDEWLQQKIGKFSSSEIHALMVSGRKKDEIFGQGALTYIYGKAWENLTGECFKDFGGNDATDWGNDWEDHAAKEFSRVTGLKVRTAGFVQKTRYYGGSVDRYVEGGAILEIKCPKNGANFVKACTGYIDPKYIIQNQSNMNVSDVDLCFHATYDPRMPEGSRIHIEEIKRDQPFIDELNERIELATEEMKRLIEIIKNK